MQGHEAGLAAADEGSDVEHDFFEQVVGEGVLILIVDSRFVETNLINKSRLSHFCNVLVGCK